MTEARTNRTLAQLAAVILLAVPLLLVIAPTGAAATTRVLAINTASAHPTVAFSGFDANPPKVFDFNGDGKLEIIAQNDNQWVYVFDSRTGAILFQARTTLPAGWGARSFNGPEVAIMQNSRCARADGATMSKVPARARSARRMRTGCTAG